MITHTQYGFKPGSTTVDCLVDLIEEISTCLARSRRLCCIVSDNKPCNFPLLLVSEQHDYFTRSASAQQLQIPHSRINIRKFCPTVIGKYIYFFFVKNKTTKE